MAGSSWSFNLQNFSLLSFQQFAIIGLKFSFPSSYSQAIFTPDSLLLKVLALCMHLSISPVKGAWICPDPSPSMD